MLKLNILSQELKNEIKHKKTYILLKSFCAAVLACACLYCIAFLGFQIVLREYSTKMIETSLVRQGDEDLAGRIVTINQELDGMSRIQKETVEWSYLLEFLSGAIASDIRLFQISADTKESRLSLIGNAGSRDSLLAFKSAIENAPFLENVDFPLKNLLEKSDINFEISAKFKDYGFKKAE